VFSTLNFNQEPENNLPMAGLVQNRITKIISLLIIVCLSLSSVANGAMLSVSIDSHDSHAKIDLEHRCHHTVNHEIQKPNPSIVVAAQNNSCEHSPSCSLVCSIAIELSAIDVFTLTHGKTIAWSAMDYLNLEPSFLSRLDRPPQA
jgi:hypothetical protein